jgi:micrococcal nuclease
VALVTLGGCATGRSTATPATRAARASVTSGAPSTTGSRPTTVGVSSTTRARSRAARLAARLPDGEDATVVREVDGDTIVTDAGKVRFIGVDTPETVDPRRPVMCFGHEAAAHTASLLPPGTRVRLAFDVERTDRYGRLLAYVYRRRDLLFVNAALVRDGYASVLTIPPDVAHVDELVALQRIAREQGRGLWSACGGPGVPLAGASSPGAPATAPRVGQATTCDPSYPDVCIPPPPPDLDCKDITYRRFRVLPPDPHHFDGDGDGIGCE